jgi:hypothetical protein
MMSTNLNRSLLIFCLLKVMCRAAQKFLSRLQWLSNRVLCPLAYDLNKSPPDTNAQLKNQRTKNVQKPNNEHQADVGFGSSQTQMIKNVFTVAPTLENLLGSMAHNGFGLCVRAGFGAQNCQPALNLNRNTKLQVCTSPRLTQNPCYRHVLLCFCYCPNEILPSFIIVAMWMM